MYSTKMAGIAGFVVKSLQQNPVRMEDSNIILSVLVPVHNEGDQIAENLSLIHAEASKAGLPMEIDRDRRRFNRSDMACFAKNG
jgi:hypothetical protein